MMHLARTATFVGARMRRSLILLAAIATSATGGGCGAPRETLSFRLMEPSHHWPVEGVIVLRARGGGNSAWLLASGRTAGEYVGTTDDRGIISGVPVQRGDILQFSRHYFGIRQLWFGLESATVIAVVPEPVRTGPEQMPAELKKVGTVPVRPPDGVVEIALPEEEGEVDIWWKITPAMTRSGSP
jgi:hypothetical protein